MLNEAQQELFTRLWTEVQPSVSGYVHAVVRDPHVTKDLVQETALVLLRKFEQWDSESEFLPWALGVAKFEILSHRRDTARSRLVFDDELLDAFTESWPSAIDEISDEQAVLHECIGKLAPKAREVIRLRYFEELSAIQIAERFDSSAGAIRISLMRVRKTLKRCVQGQTQSHGGTA